MHSFPLYYILLGDQLHDTGAILPGKFPSLADRGSTVVKMLCYKSEGRWFDPSCYHWNFSLA